MLIWGWGVGAMILCQLIILVHILLHTICYVCLYQFPVHSIIPPPPHWTHTHTHQMWHCLGDLFWNDLFLTPQNETMSMFLLLFFFPRYNFTHTHTKNSKQITEQKLVENTFISLIYIYMYIDWQRKYGPCLIFMNIQSTFLKQTSHYVRNRIYCDISFLLHGILCTAYTLHKYQRQNLKMRNCFWQIF